jgi:quercetin dioxygenase-like cupin family protein
MKGNEFFHIINDLKEGIQRELTQGISTRIFPGEQAMLSVVSIEPHAQGTVHSHLEEQWGFLLEGDGIRIQGGVEHPVKEGDFWQTPGGVPHGFIGGPKGAKILDIFSPPREEYRKSGKGYSS